MSNIVDNVFAEVCLDERIKDGVFKLEEEEHMNALRDYFVKKGVATEAAIHVTNRMLEGRFPERQAYNKDGILVTFPTPQHKAKAIQRGTHFEKNPAPQNNTPAREPEPKKELPPSPPKEAPPEQPTEKEPVSEPQGGVVTQVAQGDQQLSVEPPRGSEKPEPAPPQSPTPPPAPRTPERVAAEKEVARQIMATDDTALNPIIPPLNLETLKPNDAVMRESINNVASYLEYQELCELYKHIKSKYIKQ